jgi:hypothetical protein
MTDHERHLVNLLRRAFDGDVEKGIKEFEAYYWPVVEEVPWDSKLGEAIHTLAEDLEYFEPNAEWQNRSDPL